MLTTFKPHVQYAQRGVEEKQSRNDDRRPYHPRLKCIQHRRFPLHRFAGNIVANGNSVGQQYFRGYGRKCAGTRHRKGVDACEEIQPLMNIPGFMRPIPKPAAVCSW